jgi:hypothetical protein
MKNAVFWDVIPCGCLRTDISRERIASIIRVTRIGALGTTLAVTNNRSSLRRNTETGSKGGMLELGEVVGLGGNQVDSYKSHTA